jgi:HlyD family secretion protein
MRKQLLSQKMIVVLSTVSLLAAGCINQTTAPEGNVPVVKAWKVTSHTGSIASGKVQAEEEIQVVSKLPGKVSQVRVKEGSIVKKGDILIELESSDYLQQVKQAEAAITGAQARLADAQAGARSQELQRLSSGVAQAQAGLQVAQNSYNRMKALYDSGAISQAELEKASLELEKAKTGLEQAQAQLDLVKAGPTSNSVAALQADVERLQSGLALAKTTYENTLIHAPISGIVARRSIDPGEMAQPGVPLLMLVNMDSVKIEASVPQDQINQIKMGSTVVVKAAGMGSKTWTGTVEFVSPVSDPNSSSFPIKVKVNNQDGSLKAGMLAEVYLQDGNDHEWKLPASAIVKKANKSYLYKIDRDVVHEVEVTVGEIDRDWATVTGGVNDQDSIVMNPSEQLKDGSKVLVN